MAEHYIIHASDGHQWAEFLRSKLLKIRKNLNVKLENIDELFLVQSATRIKIQEAKNVMFLLTSSFQNKLSASSEDVYSIENLLKNRFTEESEGILNWPFAILLGLSEEEFVDEIGQKNIEKLPRFRNWTKVRIQPDVDETGVRKITERVLELIEGKRQAPITGDGGRRPSGQELPPSRTSSLKRKGFTVKLIPSTVCKGDEVAVISLCETKIRNIEISLKSGDRVLSMPASKLNPGAHSFIMPDMPVGDLTVNVKASFAKDNASAEFTITNQSIFDRLLNQASQPASLMLSTYNIRSMDSLDKLLTSFLKDLSDDVNIFLKTFEFEKQQYTEGSTSELECPSLIHFAAKFGLLEFGKELLLRAFSHQAYTIENCDGNFPLNIAEQHGNHELVDVFSQFEASLLGREIYWNIKDGMDLLKTTDHCTDYDYKRFGDELFSCVNCSDTYSPIDESIYVAMNRIDTTQTYEGDDIYCHVPRLVELDDDLYGSISSDTLTTYSPPFDCSGRHADVFIPDDTGRDYSQEELLLILKEHAEQKFTEKETILRARDWVRTYSGGHTRSFKRHKQNLSIMRSHILSHVGKTGADIQIGHPEISKDIGAGDEFNGRVQNYKPMKQFQMAQRHLKTASTISSSSTSSASSRGSRISFQDSGVEESSAGSHEPPPLLPPRTNKAHSSFKKHSSSSTSSNQLPSSPMSKHDPCDSPRGRQFSSVDLSASLKSSDMFLNRKDDFYDDDADDDYDDDDDPPIIPPRVPPRKY
ncbi:uncharacterized protein LOC141903204 isoform X2 [Tubulanus polymorphus]|uniref:uncharacterized protein LOC141903204 isoform X2 n=1 Tax=Tubulanus polymorphus TaxID=672921 RepID=UPI003DA686D9